MTTSSTVKQNQDIDYAIAGGISGFLTRFLCQPLDVVKIRFQLQVEPIKRYDTSKYQSVFQTFWLIVKEEGVTTLWKGHVPAQLLSIVYGVTSMYSYNIIKNLHNKHVYSDEYRHGIHFISGACSGIIATVVSFPFDTIRTRLVAQSRNNQVYKGLLHSCRSILSHESPKVFFYGISPTLLQIAPHVGFQFLFYEYVKDMYKRCFHDTEINMYNSMISGSIAGIIAKTIVYPMDLTRKRLQIQGFEHGRKGFGQFFKCSGLINCLVEVVKKEGVKALFKGLLPSQLKAALTTALHFTFYEQTLLIIRDIT